MIVSPIKSVIKNLTDTQVVIQVTRTRKIYIAPCGQERDTVTVAGDIFSQFDYSKNAERLAERVMNGVVTIGYTIENPYTVEKTTVRSVLLSADLIESYESWLGVTTQEDGNEEEVKTGEAETSNEPAEDKTEDKAPEDNAATEEATEEQQTPDDQDSETSNQDAEETQAVEIQEVPAITEEKKEDTTDTDATEVEEPVSKKRTTRKLKVQ